MTTDVELARQVAGGSKKAWDDLAASYGGLVRSVVNDYFAALVGTPSKQEVGELTFKVFESLAEDDFRFFRNIPEGASLPPLLAAETVKRVQAYLRSERKSGRFQGISDDSVSAIWSRSDKEEELEQKGLAPDLEEAMEGLEPLEAAVIRLFYFHELEYEDIASLLKINIGSITRTLQNGRSRLSGRLQAKGKKIDDFLYRK